MISSSQPKDHALRFPADFRWGTATSAHQVEGNNVNNDWWAWEQDPGRFSSGDRSGRACNWWEEAERDFDRAAELHQNAHRLSIEWSRVEPSPGRWDDQALDRYRQMLRGLQERGIEPMVTLHHFTNPMWVAERGGWERNDAPALFARYVEHIVPALKDFTSLWCTVNEPMAWVFNAHLTGKWPPAKHSVWRAFTAASNLVWAHAAAYRIIHRAQPDAEVGFANYFRLFDPANPALPLDRLIARQQDAVFNRAFVEAVTDGRVRTLLWRANFTGAAKTLDFLGVNYYTRDLVAFDIRQPGVLFGRNFHPPESEMSDGGHGEIYPEGMYRVLRMAAAFGKPVYVTENGLPDADDDQRPRFIVTHLYELWRALQEGVPVKGYYHWSLIDNFEWAEGWNLKFGLIAVDPVTQVRTPRPSAHLYAEICRRGELTEEILARYGRGTPAPSPFGASQA